jgi:hypothetical protein
MRHSLPEGAAPGPFKNPGQRLNRQPCISDQIFMGIGAAPGSTTMLSEIFMLKLEAIFRSSNVSAPGSSDTRFVPIKPPANPAKDSQQAGKQA